MELSKLAADRLGATVRSNNSIRKIFLVKTSPEDCILLENREYVRFLHQVSKILCNRCLPQNSFLPCGCTTASLWSAIRLSSDFWRMTKNALSPGLLPLRAKSNVTESATAGNFTLPNLNRQPIENSHVTESQPVAD